MPLPWAQIRLGECGQLYCGQSLTAADVNKAGHGHPYFTGPEQWDGKRLHVDKWTEHPKRLVPDGCIFITVKGAGVGTIFPGKSGTIGRDIYAFKVHEELDFKYVLYALTFSVDSVIGQARGDIPGLSKSHILDHEISLPGARQQRRIVEKIEELFLELEKGVESLTTARHRIGAFRQALLKYAFEGQLTKAWRAQKSNCGREAPRYNNRRAPNVAPELAEYCTEHWPWTNLGEVSKVTGGLTKSPKRSALPKSMKYLRVANVYADRLELGEISKIGVTNAEFENVRLQPGDILVVEGNGSIEQIGRVATWNGEIENVGHQNHLIRVRLIPGMLPRFFLAFLMSPLGRDLIVKQASSTSGLHTLSISKVSGLPVPIPSFEEQEAVLSFLAAPISEMKKLSEEIEIGLVKYGAMRQSILREAFSGHLVRQEIDDEPPSTLLERIKERQTAVTKKQSAPRNGKSVAA